MASFRFNPLDLSGAYLIENFFSEDHRGCFTKCFEKELFEKGGILFSLNESFVSVSAKNVVRGLHFQLHSPQAKLVCVLNGKVWDVLVDLRKSSKTYGKWYGTELTPELHNALFIPRGFAHGFVALESNSVMLYQCDGRYDKKTDTGIRYDDPQLSIEWPVNHQSVILSGRDAALMSFAEYDNKVASISNR